MKENQKTKILETMQSISLKVDERLSDDIQKREDIMYYDNFEFKGSGLAVKDIYVVEITNKNLQMAKDIYTTYEVYTGTGNLIAIVGENGKVHFTTEFLEKLRDTDIIYLQQLKLDNIDFELPEQEEGKDMLISREELEKQNMGKNEKDIKNKKEQEKEQEKEEIQEENEDERKEKTANALNIEKTQIKSIAMVNPNEKITDKYNLIDIMPEASKYKAISFVYSNANEKNHGQFTVLGVKENGEREIVNSIEPVEGVAGNKSVISINEDGSQVNEKQVKGLMRINARSRDDGFAISIGDYGKLNIDYVSDVMNKEKRRATPIRTMGLENQRRPSAKVRENAGDPKDEMQREGKIYRDNKEKGIDLQTLDGIETDSINNGITLEELKGHIKDEILEKLADENITRNEMQEIIKARIGASGLDLSQEEINNTSREIETEVIDESRFPTRGNRI